MHDVQETEAENIFDTWDIYQKIVSANNMFHLEIYADVAAILQTLEGGFSVLDLGCGDAVNLASVLMPLPVGHYCGVDLSKTALALADQNLKGLACPIEWRCGDLLQELHTLDKKYDVIFTSFALHHLNYAEKCEFFQAAHAHLNAGGFLLMIDVVREEHEDLPGYLAAYCGWLRDDWQGIDGREKAIACQHIMENDFPETLLTLQAFSVQAGFTACRTISRYQWHNVLRFDAASGA